MRAFVIVCGYIAVFLVVLWAVVGLGNAARAEANAPGHPDHPVFLLGVDGMEWSVADALQAHGELPAIAALGARGVPAPLTTGYGAGREDRRGGGHPRTWRGSGRDL